MSGRFLAEPFELPPVGGPDDWRNWPADAQEKLLARLELEYALRQPLPYFDLARPKQLPPDNPRHHMQDANGFACGCDGDHADWLYWILCAGRGIGKSFVGSWWILDQARSAPEGARFAVVGPTLPQTRSMCFNGALLPALTQAGYKRIYQGEPKGLQFKFRRQDLELTLGNGVVIQGYSADAPERIRGENLWGAWCDEVGSWRYEDSWYAALLPALRKGKRPRVVVTTTPRPTPLMKDILADDSGWTHVTKGFTFENTELSEVAMQALKRKYDGTRLGRQELYGELLMDVEGALWNYDMIDTDRISKKFVDGEWFDPLTKIMFKRIVVSIDPAVTHGETADETGIIVAGVDQNDHGYVLEDLSMRGSPRNCILAALKAYETWGANSLVIETNHGGDYLTDLIRTENSLVPIKTVWASKGKMLRAEPVSALYEQHKIHHYGTFATLEDQMTSWTPEAKKSPDRLDALVWAFTALGNLQVSDFSHAYGTVSCHWCNRPYVAQSHPNGVCPFCRKRQPLTDSERNDTLPE